MAHRFRHRTAQHVARLRAEAAERQQQVRAEDVTINGVRIGEVRHNNPGMLERFFEKLAAECDAEIAAEDAAREE